MSKLLTASIDVTKIEKNLLYKGKKGTYLNLSIWFNDEPNEYGEICSIQQTTKKDEPKIFIGNGKWHQPKPEEKEFKDQVSGTGPDSNNSDDLPF